MERNLPIPAMIQLSAVVITFNEERNIRRCIASLLPVADEVVVVDSFSRDNTEAIAREMGARFIQHPFAGHIEQKNWALKQLSYPYALSLDADEALSPELQKAILALKENPQADGYYLQRLTNYCGHWIRHGNWYPDHKLRLWKHEMGSWGGQNPHDEYRLPPTARTEVLPGHLLHYSFYQFSEHLAQIKRFTDISSRAAYQKGKRSNYLKLFTRPAWKFIKGYLLKSGFRDGRAGWQIARWSAFATYLKYRKLLELQKGHDK